MEVPQVALPVRLSRCFLSNVSGCLESFQAIRACVWGGDCRLFPHYSLCRGVYDLSVNQQLSNCEPFMGRVCEPMKDVFDLEVTGYPLLFMALLGPTMFAITILIELSESIWLRQGSAPPAPTTEDVDVTAGTPHATRPRRRELPADGNRVRVLTTRDVGFTTHMVIDSQERVAPMLTL